MRDSKEKLRFQRQNPEVRVSKRIVGNRTAGAYFKRLSQHEHEFAIHTFGDFT